MPGGKFSVTGDRRNREYCERQRTRRPCFRRGGIQPYSLPSKGQLFRNCPSKSHTLFMKECGNKEKMYFCKKPIKTRVKNFCAEKSAFVLLRCTFCKEKRDERGACGSTAAKDQLSRYGLASKIDMPPKRSPIGRCFGKFAGALRAFCGAGVRRGCPSACPFCGTFSSKEKSTSFARRSSYSAAPSPSAAVSAAS